jgi:hypothetical protein
MALVDNFVALMGDRGLNRPSVESFNQVAGRRLSDLLQTTRDIWWPARALTEEAMMAIEEFAECYAERVGTTVDFVINDLRQLGADNIRSFLSWYRSLSEADRALVNTLAGVASAVVLKILTKAVGEFVGVCLIGLLGAASWALLVRSCIDCEGRL